MFPGRHHIAGTTSFWAAIDKDRNEHNWSRRMPKCVIVMTQRQQTKGIAFIQIEFTIKGRAVVSCVGQCLSEDQAASYHRPVFLVRVGLAFGINI